MKNLDDELRIFFSKSNRKIIKMINPYKIQETIILDNNSLADEYKNKCASNIIEEIMHSLNNEFSDFNNLDLYAKDRASRLKYKETHYLAAMFEVEKFNSNFFRTKYFPIKNSVEEKVYNYFIKNGFSILLEKQTVRSVDKRKVVYEDKILMFFIF